LTTTNSVERSTTNNSENENDSSTIRDFVSNTRHSCPIWDIYGCTVCGHEIAISQTHILPDQNHARHPVGRPTLWQLIVAES
jgi:hypothetical protein